MAEHIPSESGPHKAEVKSAATITATPELPGIAHGIQKS
jgi:hypothetical protein